MQADMSWIQPDDPQLQTTGRISRTAEGKLRFIWPGSTIKGRFTGSSLQVQLEDEGRTDYQVIIDGDVVHSWILDTEPGFHAYPLAQGLPPGEHQFELFRRTETFSGATQVDGFLVDPGAGFLPWNQPVKLRLDFYGDSQTVGACNECGATEQWENLREHNHFLSYTAIASRMLGADTQTIAVSGMGLTLGYQDYTLPEIWSRLLPDPGAPEVDVRQRATDIVILNIGQNDFSRGVTAAVFGKAYAKFLGDLRVAYPKAWIVCLIGAMDAAQEPSRYPEYIGKAVEKQHDERMLFYVFKTRTKDHPRVPEHQRMAEELVGFLREHGLN